ncbi:TetR/AcrR family transcriptional regulator [Aquimarina gracilis]|uniref:TetR/AcrR family transcriptional regulator n=1 Tax=Aquimarina gracilis TaxID=874422 RepID=A0ABU6A047_9FLAO|nr:TetR/AcrR family transcriptional regulator [Aquimarina gracilis]MEB3347524.1 TetR/AcrR family transcriptional regulator [Aquimarina gracilis]
MNTKSEIIKHSVTLFNKKGFFNVSIKDITETMGISPGNFTYHFKRKEHLLEAIQEKVLENVIEVMPNNQFVTLFHFEEMFRKFYRNQRQYRFFFLEIPYLMAEYPGIMKDYKIATSKRFQDARNLINHFIASQRLIPEQDRIDYDIVIRTLWMTSTFWSARTSIIDQNSTKIVEDSPLQTLWGILLPYLTEKGYGEYLEIIEYNKTKTDNNLKKI